MGFFFVFGLIRPGFTPGLLGYVGFLILSLHVRAQALKFTLKEANQEVRSEILRPWPEIMGLLTKIFSVPLCIINMQCNVDNVNMKNHQVQLVLVM